MKLFWALHPLRMTAWDGHGNEHRALAINEVSLLRETRLTAKLEVAVDGIVRLDELICDGVLVATPAGQQIISPLSIVQTDPVTGQVVPGTLAPLGGAWWPLEIVPNFLRVIGHASPVAWAMDGFHILIFENGTFGDILVPLSVLLVLAVAFFIIGSWRFKYD